MMTKLEKKCAGARAWISLLTALTDVGCEMQTLRAPGLKRKKRPADTDLPDSNRSSKSGASRSRASASSKMSEHDGAEEASKI